MAVASAWTVPSLTGRRKLVLFDMPNGTLSSPITPRAAADLVVVVDLEPDGRVEGALFGNADRVRQVGHGGGCYDVVAG